MAGANVRTSRPVSVDWRLLVLGALALAVLLTVQNHLAPLGREPLPIGRTFAIQLLSWTVWLLLCPLIFAVARLWRQRRSPLVTAVATQLALGLAVSLLHAVLAGSGRWLLGWTAGRDLQAVLLSSMSIGFAPNLIRYGLIALAYHVVANHQEARERQVAAARLEGQLVRAKLESLQGRLRPHFLFNVLNSIAALIREDPRTAEVMVGHLGELLRASLNADPASEIPLADELDLTRQYLALQEMRFPERLTAAIEAPDELLSLPVPRLVLQPLVENAIRHGIAPGDRAGRVWVRASRVADRLMLQVEDDGLGYEPERRSPAASEPSGFGLQATAERLRLLYGDQGAVRVGRRQPSGTAATVELPVRSLAIGATA